MAVHDKKYTIANLERHVEIWEMERIRWLDFKRKHYIMKLYKDDRFVSVKISREKGVVTMCDIVEGFVSQGLSQGDARTLVKCVESLMHSEDITASEACEKLNYTLEEYKEAKEVELELV